MRAAIPAPLPASCPRPSVAVGFPPNNRAGRGLRGGLESTFASGVYGQTEARKVCKQPVIPTLNLHVYVECQPESTCLLSVVTSDLQPRALVLSSCMLMYTLTVHNMSISHGQTYGPVEVLFLIIVDSSSNVSRTPWYGGGVILPRGLLTTTDTLLLYF